MEWVQFIPTLSYQQFYIMELILFELKLTHIGKEKIYIKVDQIYSSSFFNLNFKVILTNFIL
jgi:hypothetical protein